jgi:hypothetical protein
MLQLTPKPSKKVIHTLLPPYLGVEEVSKHTCPGMANSVAIKITDLYG